MQTETLRKNDLTDITRITEIHPRGFFKDSATANYAQTAPWIYPKNVYFCDTIFDLLHTSYVQNNKNRA